MASDSPLPEYNIHNDEELSKLEGLTTARIENLSDGVFSIAMTILVLDLKLPADVQLSHLPLVFNTIWPQFVSYFLSFIVLGSLWVNHHNQFHWIQISNRKFLWINIFFLCFISLIPFSTILLRAHEFEPLAIVIYGCNIIGCLSLLYINWKYASDRHRLVVANLTKRTIHIIQLRLAVVIGIYIIGILTSFIHPLISLIIYVIMQILFIMPASYLVNFAARMRE